MQFPFLPYGIVLAGVVLAGVIAAFGAAIWLVDRAVLEVRTTVLAGLVVGMEAWRDGTHVSGSSPESVSPSGSDDRETPDRPDGGDDEIEEVTFDPGVATEAVRG